MTQRADRPAAGLRAWLYHRLEPHAASRGSLSLINRIIAVLIVASATCAVLETEPSMYGLAPLLFDWSEVLFGTVFLVEYCARIYAAGEDPRYRGVRGRLGFAVTGWMLIDLVALLPFLLSALPLNTFILRLLRLLRLLRMARLGRFSEALTAISEAIHSRAFELLVSVMIAVLLLVISSTVIYVFEAEQQPETFGSIPRALWWSVATLTTVGYGDVTPVTALGKIFAGFTAVAGIGMIAMPTGILAAAFSEAMQRRRASASTVAEGRD